MCGRVVWVWDPLTGQLVRKYDDGALDDPELRHVLEKMRYNVPPASHLPVIKEQDGGTQVTIARWGFPIPQRPNGVFNTRVESAFDSPMWRQMIGRSHGILPVKGFYEWKRDGKTKTPYFVYRADGAPMLLATVVGWRRIDDDARLCMSVVTCPPNDALGRLHDRMPVVLEGQDADAWLHPGDAGRKVVGDLAVPAGDVLAMHEVDPLVNSTDNDEPGLIEPARQRRLF